MDLDELRDRALRVHDLYDRLNLHERGRVWTREEFMLGFAGDVGDLAKLVMAEEGAREVAGGRQALEHELADCLWSVLILSYRYGVDLEAAFLRTMTELDRAISAKLPTEAEAEAEPEPEGDASAPGPAPAPAPLPTPPRSGGTSVAPGPSGAPPR
ncbi:nucleotide pyrophosphohydrolase [Streptomyces sp. NPDC001840]